MELSSIGAGSDVFKETLLSNGTLRFSVRVLSKGFLISVTTFHAPL